MNYIIETITNIFMIALIVTIFIVLIIIASKVIRINKIKNLVSIECSNYMNEISLDDDRVRKTLINEIKRIKNNLQKIYLNSNWDNRRFLHEIMKDLEMIKSNLKRNSLSEDDLYKINIIIDILKMNSNNNIICEKVIFEWDKLVN